MLIIPTTSKDPRSPRTKPLIPQTFHKSPIFHQHIPSQMPTTLPQFFPKKPNSILQYPNHHIVPEMALRTSNIIPIDLHSAHLTPHPQIRSPPQIKAPLSTTLPHKDNFSHIPELLFIPRTHHRRPTKLTSNRQPDNFLQIIHPHTAHHMIGSCRSHDDRRHRTSPPQKHDIVLKINVHPRLPPLRSECQFIAFQPLDPGFSRRM